MRREDDEDGNHWPGAAVFRLRDRGRGISLALQGLPRGMVVAGQRSTSGQYSRAVKSRTLDDDRATLLGAFMELADRLRGADDAGDDPRHLATRWRRRGLRAFDADREAAAPAVIPPVPEGPAV